MDAGHCTLELAVARRTDCPGHRCPFWESEGGGCPLQAIEGQLIETPALAQHLLELRTALVAARRALEDESMRTAAADGCECSRWP